MNCRPATLEDATLLYRWRREGESADWYEGSPTTESAHADWFAERVHSHLVRIWIVEDEGRAVGVIRLDSNDELSVEIDPRYRGMGYGTEAIRWACAQAEGRVKACVDSSNDAARRAFLKAGFKHRPDVDFYIWRP